MINYDKDPLGFREWEAEKERCYDDCRRDPDAPTNTEMFARLLDVTIELSETELEELKKNWRNP